MVEAAIIRMRLLTYADLGGAIAPELKIPNSILAAEPKTIKINIIGTPADAAGFSEIDPVTGHMLESTAVAMELISSSADDNASAAGAVQGVYSIGIDGSDDLVQRAEAMHATDGTTVVTTTNLYKENFHGFSGLHGTSDMDAAGNIQMRDIADNVCWTIAATKNESDGSAIKIPDNHLGMLTKFRVRRLAPAAGVYAADEGVRIRIVYINALDGETGMAAANRCNNWLEIEAVGAYQAQAAHPCGFVFEEGTWLHLQHSSKVDAGEQYELEVEYIIWKK